MIKKSWSIWKISDTVVRSDDEDRALYSTTVVWCENNLPKNTWNVIDYDEMCNAYITFAPNFEMIFKLHNPEMIMERFTVSS